MNLHIGNGTVYLKGWMNVDIVGKLAKDYPELVDENITTIDKYYRYPFRTHKDIQVTDMIMDARDLSYFRNDSIDKILSVNLVDHMKKEDFLKALIEWKRVLKKGGELIIDTDDRIKQAEILTKAKTIDEIEWGLRLIYCDHKAIGRTHFWGYAPFYLKQILLNAGFTHKWTRTDFIVHDVYPNFQICVTK